MSFVRGAPPRLYLFLQPHPRPPLSLASRAHIFPPPPRLRHLSATSRLRNENENPESEGSPNVSLEDKPPPEPKPVISYTTAALILITSASFLSYRLFYYSPSSGDDAPLSNIDFVKRTLTSKIPVSTTSAVFNFNGAQGDGADDLWTKGVWSLEFKQPQLQIARAYTPLPPVKLLEESEGAWQNRTKGFRFLIRREPAGEVSGYLHGLSQGAKLELRGPHLELAIPPDVSEVVFLAGGTGIAPALQLAYALSRRAASTAPLGGQPVRMSILWANRTKEDVGAGLADAAGSFQQRLSSIPAQLEAIRLDKRAGERFQLDTRMFVDEQKRFIQAKDIEAVVGGRSSGRRMILVSGPDGFVAHYAGPRQLENGVETQGPLGGVLAALKPRGWEVWKL